MKLYFKFQKTKNFIDTSMMRKYNFLPIIYFNLLLSALSFDHIKPYTSSILAQSGQSYVGALIENNGKVGYNSVELFDGSFLIRKYSLIQNPPLLIGQFQILHNFSSPQRFFLFKNYLLVFTTLLHNVAIYQDDTFNFLGFHSYNQIPDNFVYAKSRGLVLLTTSEGNTAYIQEEHFPFTTPDKIHNLPYTNFATDNRGFMSKNQQFYTMVSLNSDKIWIFSLQTLSLAFEYSTSGDNVVSGDWHSTQNVCYVSSLSSKTLYVINVTANFSVTSFQYLNVTENSFVYQIKYFLDSNEIVGIKYINFSINVFGFDLTTETLTEQSFGQIEDFAFDPNNSSFIQMLKNDEVLFYEVNSCDHGQIFDTCSKSCQPCTNCTFCSKIGCDFCILNSTLNSTDNASDTNLTSNSLNDSSIQNFITNKSILQDFLASQYVINYNTMINSTLASKPLQYLNLVPGARKIFTPFFSFFLNFDDLWLYLYHPRTYDPVITTAFDSILQLQTKKWEILNFQIIFNHLGYDQNIYHNIFTFKNQYTSANFLYIQQNSNGFLPNTPNFLFSNIILTFLIFIVFKLLQRLLSKFRMSQLLNNYKHWPFLFLMLIEGNFQYFAYLLIFDFRNFFAGSFSFKVLNLMVIMIGFTILVCGGFFYFFVRIVDVNKSDNLMDNYKNSMRGIIYLTFCSNIRNMAIGMTHCLLDQNYDLKISLLLLLEGIFLSFYLMGVSRKLNQCPFEIKSRVWCQIVVPSIIRICLITTIKKNYSTEFEGSCIVNRGLMILQIMLLYSYIGTYLIGIMIDLVGLTVQVVSLFSKQDRFLKQNEQQIVNEKNLEKNQDRFLKGKDKQTENDLNVEETSSIINSTPIPQQKSVFLLGIMKSKNCVKFIQKKQQQEQSNNIFENLCDKFESQNINKNIRNKIKFKKVK